MTAGVWYAFSVSAKTLHCNCCIDLLYLQTQLTSFMTLGIGGSTCHFMHLVRSFVLQCSCDAQCVPFMQFGLMIHMLMLLLHAIAILIHMLMLLYQVLLT